MPLEASLYWVRPEQRWCVSCEHRRPTDLQLHPDQHRFSLWPGCHQPQRETADTVKKKQRWRYCWVCLLPSISDLKGPPLSFHFRSWKIWLHMWIKHCLAPEGAMWSVIHVFSVNWDRRLNKVSFPHTHLIWKQRVPFSLCITQPESVSHTWVMLWCCNNEFA